MNDKNNTITIVKNDTILLFIVSTFFAIVGISVFMHDFHSWRYLDFGVAGAGLFIILLSIMVWLEGANYKQITFTPQEIIIKHLFKTTRYHLDNNTTYNILIGKKDQPILTIKGKDYHFNINKLLYPDFPILKVYVQKNYRLNRTLKKAKGINDQNFQYLFMGLGVILTLFAVYLKCFEHNTIPKKLAYIEIKMAKNPIIYNPSKGSKALKLYSVAYPEFKFRTKGAFTSAQRKIARIVKKGDVIKIGIEPEDLQAKLLKTHPSTFWERHYGWFRIFVESIEFEGQAYKKNQESPKNFILTWILLFFGIIFIWFGWYN